MWGFMVWREGLGQDEVRVKESGKESGKEGWCGGLKQGLLIRIETAEHATDDSRESGGDGGL